MKYAVIFLSFAAVLAIYAVSHRLWRSFAERELRKSGNVRFAGDTVEIFAAGESFEYLFRLALALPDAKIRVYLGEDEEARCIAEILERFYEFEIVRI